MSEKGSSIGLKKNEACVVKVLIALLIIACFGCQKESMTIKIAATPIPHVEMLKAIQSDLKEKGITLRIIEVDDYNLPNRLLFEKQVDANFFQHKPFLEAQEKAFNYHFAILATVHFEPLGLYSKKVHSLQDLPSGGTLALPSDPTNEARALELLAALGLITLSEDHSQLSTVRDVQSNPKHFRFQEVDAAFLPRALPDVDAAIIPGNFALQARLSPSQDALAEEKGCSPYANLLVVRTGDETRPELQILAEALRSEKMALFLQNRYSGTVQLTHSECK